MCGETDNIIKSIQDLITEYEGYRTTSAELVEEQERALVELIDKYKTVYAFIKKSHYTFTHPRLEYRSNNGPILGYQEDDGRLIIYSVEDNSIKITDIGEKYNDDKLVSVHYLVENGYFSTAVEGLKYLEGMFENYVTDMAKRVSRLDEELNKVK